MATEASTSGQSVVVFLDEVDVLCPIRQASHVHEARIVAQLLTLIDGLNTDPGGCLPWESLREPSWSVE